MAALLFWFAVAENSPAGSPESMPAERVFEKASPAVVSVVVTGEGGLVKRGTGFIVSDDGLVATNYHVIKDGRSAEVILPTLAKLVVKGVVASNPDWDLAILRVEGKSLPFLKIAKDDPKIGAKVYAIGNPKGLTNTLSDGLVSGVREVTKDLSLLQTTAAISPGSSGGPLLADSGEVVGITTASLVTGQNLNFAVSGKLLLSLLNKIGQPISLSKFSTPATTSAPADGQIINSFLAVVLRTPRSILPVDYTGGASYTGFGASELKITELGINAFNVWASENIIGKQLRLRVTSDDGFSLVVPESKSEVAVRMGFFDQSQALGVRLIHYEIEAVVTAQQAALLAELSTGGSVEIGGAIKRYRAENVEVRKRFVEHKRQWYISDKDEKRITPIPLAMIDPHLRNSDMQVQAGTQLRITIALEDFAVRRYVEPVSTPASKPDPPVRSREEPALARAALAKSYLEAGMKEKALKLLKSVIADFPETKAAVQAQQEIERLIPVPSKKE